MFDASRCIHHACTIFIFNLLTVFDSSSLNKPRVFLCFLIFFLWIIYLYSLRYIFMSYNTWNLKLPQYYNSFWDFNLRLLGFFFWDVERKIFTIKKKFIYEYNKRISSNLTVLFRNSYEYDMELFYGKCCAMTNSCKTQ